MRTSRTLPITLLLMLALALPAVATTKDAEKTKDASSSTLTEVDVIPTKEAPSFLAMSPFGKALYASGNTGILVIDPTKRAQVGVVHLERGQPRQMAISPDGSTGYVAISQSEGVSSLLPAPHRLDVIDLRKGAVARTIPLRIGGSDGPTGIALNASGSRAYVTDQGKNIVYVIDTTTWKLAYVEVGKRPTGIAVTPDDRHVYVAESSGMVTVLDARSLKPMAWIDTGLPAGSGFVWLTIADDGRKAYVTRVTDSRIAVLDIDPWSRTYHTTVRTIETEGRLQQLLLRPNGREALVLQTFPPAIPGRVAIVDLLAGTVTRRIQVGILPFGIVGNADAGAVYVSNNGSQNIAVINSLTGIIGDLPPDAFIKDDRRESFVKKAEKVEKHLADGDLCKAIDKAFDVLPKMDGDPSPPDWIVDERARAEVREFIESLIKELTAQAEAEGGCM